MYVSQQLSGRGVGGIFWFESFQTQAKIESWELCIIRGHIKLTVYRSGRSVGFTDRHKEKPYSKMFAVPEK